MGRGEVMVLLENGVVTIQDLTAQLVAPFVDPQRDERVVDMCAAPGGKTTHMAELMQDQGHVDALDVIPDRVARLRENVQRNGLSSVTVHEVDSGHTRPLDHADDALVDRVLVDVPCSNSGVLRRRVEARWRLPQAISAELLSLQAR